MNTDHELLIDLLQDVDKALAEQIKVVLEKHDLALTTAMIVFKLKKNPGITVSELSRISKIAKSHVSNIIEQMAKMDWVEKRPNPSDQRVLQLHLTERALEHVEIIRTDIRKHMSCIVTKLSEERKTELINGLQDLKAALEEAKKENHLICKCGIFD